MTPPPKRNSGSSSAPKSSSHTEDAKPPLLVIENLHIEGETPQGWVPVVQDISLTLRRGEVMGLIGESGAGKSTLGLAAMGYVRPGCRFSGGRVVFDGQELLAAPEKARRSLRGVRIAYVAQAAAAAFNPAHRLQAQAIETSVFHGVKTAKEARDDSITLFTQFQLPSPETIGFRYPHQVSGGQLQRAMLAMAMACRPDLIIFDEPTTALDVTTQIEVLAAIRSVVDDFGTAGLYISHDLAVVVQLAHKVMVLRGGKKVESASTQVILKKPAETYTKELLSVRSQKKPTGSYNRKDYLLTIRNVSAGYGKLPVLRDVNLNVGFGRTVALVGESGSGKSTLARVVTGLLPPSEGTIMLGDETLAPDYRKRPPEQLQTCQMVYQIPDTALNPRQRVRDVIGRPLTFYKGLRGSVRDEKVRDYLRLIELEPDKFMDCYPSGLSGGQKQRVCLARALCVEPSLVICDEVTSALDQLVAEEILKLLTRLQKELGLSYLFITHDISTVRAIADEVVVMYQGSVIEQGPRESMFVPPHHPYTDLLLSSVPVMDDTWLERHLAHRETLSGRAGGAGGPGSGPA